MQKFAMYRTLVSQHGDPLTITDLSKRLSLSYQQSYNIFQELARDLAATTSASRPEVKRALTRGRVVLPVDRYRAHLLEEALAFQFIDYVAQSNLPSIDQFCATHFISHSTLLRKTAPVRKFLARFRLKLSLTQARFTGDEKQVRLFLNAFYWLGFHGTKWPFAAIDARAVATQYDQLPTASTDPITRTQEQVFWAVCRTRLAHGFTVTWDGAPLPLTAPDTVYTHATFPRLPTRALRDESRFFLFVQAKSLRFTPLTPQESALMTTLQAQDALPWQVAAALMAYLSNCDDTIAAPMWEDPQLVMNLLRLCLAWTVMGGDYVKPADFFTTSQLSYQQPHLQALLTAFVKTLPDTLDMAPFKTDGAAFVTVLCDLFVPYRTRNAWTDRVHVALWMPNTDIATANVRRFLANIGAAAVLHQDADLNQADLLIATADDFAAGALPDFAGPRITWYLDATEADYHRLYRQIITLYSAKLRRNAESTAG
ncbi:helix-turn-helix domain-containing protein [Lacticaseibacillus kribbianus]|uniref:helix-turn-helix domain-containing protein n=1 Tax=Lacticaseibacillus kribbianus TaxID=2926292 RepID=UPI001CD6BA98|nr:helix-turn-helix domain-containing protein [Lacticaseibacillus kribbianus]